MSEHAITVLQPEEYLDIDYWVPSHGLKEALDALADGKKVVFLGACDCGCWKEEMSQRAVNMIKEAGLEGKVYHNLVRLYQGWRVVIYPPELRPDEYHVASILPL